MRYQLWCEAALVIKLCPLPVVNEMNQVYMHIHACGVECVILLYRYTNLTQCTYVVQRMLHMCAYVVPSTSITIAIKYIIF